MRLIVQVFAMLVAGCILLVAGFSCSKKTTKPKPVEYRLYAGVSMGGEGYIFVIDAETDSVIDSVGYEGYNYIRMNASPDGKYLGVYGGDPCLRIYNPADLTVLAELDCRLEPAFAPNAGVILGTNRSGISFFDYSSFEPINHDTLAFYEPQVIGSQGVVFGQLDFGETRLDSTGFVKYDYRDRRIVKSWHRFPRPDGGSYRIVFRFHVRPDGRRIYGTAGAMSGDGSPGGAKLFCYDLEGDSSVFESSIYAPYGGVRVSPDGREVYLTDPGMPGGWESPGKIFVYDANNGALLNEISLLYDDPISGQPRPLYAYEIRFHPKKPKAYVGCGDMLKGPGAILVIDTQKREIVKWIFPNLDRTANFIDIGPKL